MTASVSVLLVAVFAAILIGAVLFVVLRNNNKPVPPRERDEHGAPIAKS